MHKRFLISLKGTSDQTVHLFLSCPMFHSARTSLFRRISTILSSSPGNSGFSSLSSSEKLRIILYGDEAMGPEESVQLQEAVQEFVDKVNT